MPTGYIDKVTLPDSSEYTFKNSNLKVYSGTCNTAGEVAIKEVTTDDSFVLEQGVVIFVTFNYTNSAAVSGLKLIVNSTNIDNDAKSIKYLKNSSDPTDIPDKGYLRSGQTYYFSYDGNYWVTRLLYDQNTIPTALSTSTKSTTDKTASCSYWTDTANSYIHILFRYGNNTDHPTLNINSTGGKPIYVNGIQVDGTTANFSAGSYLAFYDGTNYHLRTDGRLPGIGIAGDAATVNGHTVETSVPAGAVFTDTYDWGSITAKPTSITGYGIKDAHITAGVITLGNAQMTPVTSVNSHTGSAITLTAADLNLANAMHFLGVSTTEISNTGTQHPTIGSQSVTPAAGDVVIFGAQEYVWSSIGKWALLGDESSYALLGHVHGSIANNGSTTSSVTIANNDRLVIVDSSDNNKIVGSSLQFNVSSSVTRVLSEKGSWIDMYQHPTVGGGLHVPESTTADVGKFLQASTTAGSYSWEEITGFLPLGGGTITGALTVQDTLTFNDIVTSTATYGATLPSTTATGRLFFLTSNAIYELPSGGSTGQALIKSSSSDRDVTWGTVGGSANLLDTSTYPNNSYYVACANTYDDPATMIYDTSVYVKDTVLFGAAWNDYAEYRHTLEEIEPGRCVVENGFDSLSLSNKRLQPGAEIVSDTFGFAIGQTKHNKTPVAIAGRVLAFPYEPIENFKPGLPVCSGPYGTVSIMTEKEASKYPWLIIGTVSSIPRYEEWGENHVKVKGRVWIRVR